MLTRPLIPSLLELKRFEGTAVAPSEPREKEGLYWGYTVRVADSLTQIFTQSPYKVRHRPAGHLFAR